MSPLPYNRPRRPAQVLALGATALALVAGVAGCGSGSGNGVGDTQGQSAPAAKASHEPVVNSSDPATRSAGATEIVRANYPYGPDNDEISATGAKPVKPCGLVSRAQAVRILGAGVNVSERPQGPTCIYTGSGRQITTVVEEAPLAALRSGARKKTKVSVNGNSGWCLSYETTSVVIDAGHGRVLQVTGPCAAGVRFAAIALPRISG